MTAASSARQRSRPPVGAIWVGMIATLEVLAVVADLGPPIQPSLAFLFVITCPGFLIIDMPHPRDLPSRLVLGVGASLAINVLIFTVGAVAEVSWIAPAVAIALLVVAVLPRERIRPLLNRLKGASELASPPATSQEVSEPLDLNSAGVRRLATLPGVGMERARRIVAYREERGGLNAIEDLLDVPGVTPATLAAIEGRAVLRTDRTSAEPSTEEPE